MTFTPADLAMAATIADAIGAPGQVHTRLIDRVARANDASHYLHVPEAVVVARDAADVGAVFASARESRTPVTLRSGGTSLCGQSSGDGIQVDVRRNFRGIEVLDGGRRVRVQPGATVKAVNTVLGHHGYKLGPDPASESAATIGGVIANNSSGMYCGTEFNTYQTIRSMVFVLPSGTVIDTADADADQQLAQQEPDLHLTLATLRDRVRGNAESRAIIERHFALKNTMGYGVNSFLDHEDPVDILMHLIVGSEGTLAFVAEAVFETLPVLPLATTALAVFNDLHAATSVLPDLVGTGAATLELMDATSLRVGQSLPGVPDAILGFEVDRHAALLIEYHAETQEQLEQFKSAGQDVLSHVELRAPAMLNEDAVQRTAAWHFRKGLYTSVAGMRTSGTTALLEDVAVPVATLAETCESLQGLFDQYGYADSVIFGHAKDGNIHFMLTDRFEGEPNLTRYLQFNDQMVDLVLGHEGNLKAEHGTGRAMAPYVRRQYGDELYDVMVKVKLACDPTGVMNPGVIIDNDPESHIRDIKLMPKVEDEVDRCVECGYCEPVCPSKDLTLTPRQRIVVRRAIKDARDHGDEKSARELEKDYTYDAIQTCAVDGMCEIACPLGINTALLTKHLRREDRNPVIHAAWQGAAAAWGPFSRIAATALTAADHVPAKAVGGVTKAIRAVLGDDVMPLYQDGLPDGGEKRRSLTGRVGSPTAPISGIYVPACVNSMFGPEGHTDGVTEAFVKLLERAGIALEVPVGVEALCCGTPWSSKGMVKGHDTMQKRALRVLLDATDNGALPVISDAVSCTEGFEKMLAESGVPVQDAVTFTVTELLPRIGVPHPVDSIVLHPTCSSKHMGVDTDLEAIARAVAHDVHIPDDWGCCAFAGDRGMLHPELTESATAREAAEVATITADAHASLNRTCEVGMTRATGQPYRHILEVLEEASRN